MAYRKMRFYRLQDAGISFADMQRYDSFDSVIDEDGDEVMGQPGGLCTTDRTNDSFGGAWGAYDDTRPGEIVVMEGEIVEQIYDGYRINPTREIARFTTREWAKMVEDETIEDALDALQDSI